MGSAPSGSWDNYCIVSEVTIKVANFLQQIFAGCMGIPDSWVQDN